MKIATVLLLVGLPVRLLAEPAASAYWDDPLAAAAGADIGQVRLRTLRAEVELAPVTVADVIEPGSQYLGASRRFAAAGGGGLEAAGGIVPPRLRPYVRRELTALWTLEVPADNTRAVQASDLRIRMSHADGPLARAEIRPVIQDVERTADGGRRVIGGAVFLIPTDALQAAGRFRARVELDVEYLP